MKTPFCRSYFIYNLAFDAELIINYDPEDQITFNYRSLCMSF